MSYQRLKTNINGGFPLVLDDIRFLQGEFEAPFLNYMQNICPADGAVWIRGGNFPNSLSPGINGGVVYIKNQGFFNVRVNNLAGWSGATTFLRIVSSNFDSAGLKTFQNGTSNNTYELPQADIVTGTAGAGDIILNKWVYLNQSFGDEIGSLGASVTEDGAGIRVKVSGNYVTLQFQLDGPAGVQNTDYTLFTFIGDIFDASQGVLFECFDENQDIIKMQIDSSGNLRARGDITPFEFRLAGEVTFRIR